MTKLYYLEVHFKDGTKVEITPSNGNDNEVIHTWPAPGSDQETCEEIAKFYISAPELERQRDELLADLDTAKFALLRISQSNTSGWTNDPSEVASFAIETATDALTAIARARSSGSGQAGEQEG